MTQNELPASLQKNANVTTDPWTTLKQFTDARIALGRSGVSLPTQHVLAFQLAHAQAQDAVHLPLDLAALRVQLASVQALGSNAIHALHSRADSRGTYLQRPDLGRQLNQASRDKLYALAQPACDLAIVIVDGLSAHAVHTNVVGYLNALLPELMSIENRSENGENWQLAPLTLVEQGRVAIGDEVGALLHARIVLVLIGERPGLSSPDSLGIYLTWNPCPGKTDAERNCISNIRPAGMSHAEAARKTLYLLRESRRRKLSGIDLKEAADEQHLDADRRIGNFLVGNE